LLSVGFGFVLLSVGFGFVLLSVGFGLAGAFFPVLAGFLAAGFFLEAAVVLSALQ
jgi:hypothetical protein